MMMDILPLCDQDHLRWKSKGKRSNRPDFDFDEISAAEALISLANSNGGFCCTAPLPTSSLPSKTDSEIFLHPRKKQKILSCSGAPDSANFWFKKDEPNSPDSPLLLQGASHQCLECGKVFKSHQALGGHMTRHRRKIQASAATTAVIGGIHECLYCHEKFSIGQALGGHMRKHYNNSVKKFPENQLISHCDDSGGATRLEFDLNMPAVEELDGEEEQF